MRKIEVILPSNAKVLKILYTRLNPLKFARDICPSIYMFKRNCALIICLPVLVVNVSMGEAYILRSRILREDRTLYIYLPRDYESSQMLNPVIYLLDGDRLFNYTAATVDYYINTYRIPPMIVVGIESTDRRRDFTPTAGSDRVGRPATGGGADVFLRFMKEELFPYIEGNYQTMQYRAIIGHSLGGLFVIHALLSDPCLFGAYMALSPFLAWDNGVLVRRTEIFFKETRSMNKLLFVASESMSRERQVSPMEDFAHLLKTCCPEGLEWEYKLYEGSDHMNLPVLGIPEGLDFFFPGIVQNR